ncbi:MAG TPA: glycosyltransferase family 4 protein [Actinomycetota bacterium]|nr:glycosyltransferase family 4 protein [Actinomycetota bacterium]
MECLFLEGCLAAGDRRLASAVRMLEITNDFPPTMGGIENYIYSIVRQWKPDDVVVLTRLGGTPAEAAAVDATLSAEVRREPVRRLLPTRRVAEHALRLLRDRHFDVVHFASPLPLAALGPRLSRETGVPYAVSVHGGEFVAGARLARPIMQRVLGGAAVALPVSSFTEAAIRQLLPHPPPTVIVRPGVDADRFAPGLVPAFTGGGPVVLTACRLIRRKGPSTLIAALPRVLEAHPDAVLAIAGDGPDRRRLERAAAGSGVRGSVRFLGALPWSTLGSYYAAADVFALPTRERFGGLETEGFPLVYLEAAAAGLPVVAGRAGGVRDGVVDGETGVIVDGRSPEDTAAAINALLDDPARARAMGDAGRRRVLDDFSWQRAADRFRWALETHA